MSVYPPLSCRPAQVTVSQIFTHASAMSRVSSSSDANDDVMLDVDVAQPHVPPSASSSLQPPPVVIRNTEDIMGYLQRKNPGIVPFDHEGRQCIKFVDFYMAVCNVKKTSARSARNRLCDRHPELYGRIVMFRRAGSEFHRLLLSSNNGC